MALINLHNHSSYSDGTLTPRALVREAALAGIKYFSLTDHDMVGGWVEIEPALKEAGIAYCRGVELTTNLQDSLHILGYGVDVNNVGFLDQLAGFRAGRLERLRKIVALLQAQGIEIKFEELLLEKMRTVGRPHIADLLKKKGVVTTRKQGFHQYVAYGRPAYVPPSGPDVETAILAIKKAGGLAVLAHPGAVAAEVMDLPAWKAAGLDGIEAFYPTHTGAATRDFVSLAARHGLFVTAGSDFHGPGSERDKMTGFEYSDEYFSEIRKLFICK